MRKKLIFLRSFPIFVIVILIIVFMKNDFDYIDKMSLESNETLTKREALTHPILNAFDQLNSLLKKRAYSNDQVNHTKLYENLKLIKLNLEFYGHLCKSEDLNSTFILIGLMSRVDSFERRNLIRETLGKQVKSSNQKLLFFVGESLNETINELVDDEVKNYEDIVRLEFTEDYYNLTLKTLSFLEYFNNFCDNSFKYAIKLDDDVFLNWFVMHTYLINEISNNKPIIYCKVHRRSRVIRDQSNKWYLDREIYPKPIYPNYCGGPIYILNKEAVKKVIKQHEKIKKKILVLEDVYTTGICTDHTEIELRSVLTFLNKRNTNFFIRNYLNSKIMAIHPIINQEYSELYFSIENLYRFL